MKEKNEEEKVCAADGFDCMSWGERYRLLAGLDGAAARQACRAAGCDELFTGFAEPFFAEWEWFRLAFGLELAGALVDDDWLKEFTGLRNVPEGGLQGGLNRALALVGAEGGMAAVKRRWEKSGFRLGFVDACERLDLLHAGEHGECWWAFPALVKPEPRRSSFVNYTVLLLPDRVEGVRAVYGVLYDDALFVEYEVKPAGRLDRQVDNWVDSIRESVLPELSDVRRTFEDVFASNGLSGRWSAEVLFPCQLSARAMELDLQGYAVKVKGPACEELLLLADPSFNELRFEQCNSCTGTTALLRFLLDELGNCWSPYDELAHSVASAIQQYEEWRI